MQSKHLVAVGKKKVVSGAIAPAGVDFDKKCGDSALGGILIVGILIVGIGNIHCPEGLILAAFKDKQPWKRFMEAISLPTTL